MSCRGKPSSAVRAAKIVSNTPTRLRVHYLTHIQRGPAATLPLAGSKARLEPIPQAARANGASTQSQGTLWIEELSEIRVSPR